MNPRGWTLLEMLVVLAILGILLGIMAVFIRREPLELNRASSDLKIFITKARFEAIKRNVPIVLTTGKGGVVAVIDTNANRVWDTDESLLDAVDLREYLPSMAINSSLTGFSSKQGFAWMPDGLPASLGPGGINRLVIGRFVLQHNNRSRWLCMNRLGRMYVLYDLDLDTGSCSR